MSIGIVFSKNPVLVLSTGKLEAHMTDIRVSLGPLIAKEVAVEIFSACTEALTDLGGGGIGTLSSCIKTIHAFEPEHHFIDEDKDSKEQERVIHVKVTCVFGDKTSHKTIPFVDIEFADLYQSVRDSIVENVKILHKHAMDDLSHTLNALGKISSTG